MVGKSKLWEKGSLPKTERRRKSDIVSNNKKKKKGAREGSEEEWDYHDCDDRGWSALGGRAIELPDLSGFDEL